MALGRARLMLWPAKGIEKGKMAPAARFPELYWICFTLPRPRDAWSESARNL